jgi:thiol-disulfide isomerase/thioredoxin
MRRGWSFLLLSIAFAGCKSGDRDSNVNSKPIIPPGSTSKDPASSGHWLDSPSATTKTQTPAAGTWVNPSDPNYDYATESRGQLAGFVVDDEGRKISNAFVRIESTSGAKAEPYGVLTTADGSFLLSGLKAGQSYTITVEAKDNERTLVGRAIAKAPNVRLRIPLMEGDAKTKEKPITEPKKPAPTEEKPTPNLQSGAKPFDQDLPAPIALPTDNRLTPARGDLPTDGGFSPVEPRPVLPVEDPVRTIRPDLMTGDSRPDWRAPAANIPKSPAIPSTPAPDIKPAANPNQFQLVDVQNRTRNVPSGRAGELVLLDFMTTSCVPCVKMIPTLKVIQEKYAARGLDVIAVTCDDEPLKTRLAYAERYRKKYDLNYQLYAEPGNKPGPLLKRFGIERYPTVVLLNSAGDVLWQGHPSRTEELINVIEKNLR